MHNVEQIIDTIPMRFHVLIQGRGTYQITQEWNIHSCICGSHYDLCD